MNFRSAMPADAPALARLHLETLPAGLSDLSPLGEGLVRHFYARAIERGAAQARVAEEGGQLLGYVVVTDDIGTLFQRALLAGPGDVLTFLGKSNPFGLARAFVAKLTSGTVSVPSAPELVYIGVSEKARGRRLGRRMMYEGQKALDDAGFRGYQLTVRADNEHAVRLYHACGFEVVQRYMKSGHENLRMVCNVSPPPPPPA
jgi:ribosomal protein S18 acetylase RimI-like enzyme